MKNSNKRVAVSMLVSLLFCSLLLFSFRSPKPSSTLKENFEYVADAYLDLYFQQNLAGTQTTLLTKTELDTKVGQIIANTSCSARKVHYKYVLSSYKNDPTRAALLVTGAQSPAPSEFLMFSIPKEERVLEYIKKTHFPIFASAMGCDTIEVERGYYSPQTGGLGANNSGGISVFDPGFSADAGPCICVTTCGEEGEPGCSYCN